MRELDATEQKVFERVKRYRSLLVFTYTKRIGSFKEVKGFMRDWAFYFLLITGFMFCLYPEKRFKRVYWLGLWLPGIIYLTSRCFSLFCLG